MFYLSKRCCYCRVFLSLHTLIFCAGPHHTIHSGSWIWIILFHSTQSSFTAKMCGKNGNFVPALRSHRLHYLWITLGQQVERFWVGEKYGSDAQCKCSNAKNEHICASNASCEQYEGKLNEMEGNKKVANVNGIIWRRVENDCAQIKTNKIIKIKLN